MIRLEICLILIFVCQETVADTCPNTWLQYNGSCYLISKELHNFVGASIFCRRLQSHLAMINSRKEQEYIEHVLNQTHQEHDFWIGATDMVHEGHWNWYGTLDNLQYMNWCPNEPNNAYSGDGEDCAAINVDHPQRRFCWNDYICTGRHNVICEKSIVYHADTTTMANPSTEKLIWRTIA